MGIKNDETFKEGSIIFNIILIFMKIPYILYKYI